MKSKHRHELETNALAQRLAVMIDRMRPYASTVVGIAVAVAVVLLGLSYMSGTSAARQTEAWNAYNQAIKGLIPDLEALRLSAEEHAGTPTAHWALVTWADGQVWMGSRAYIQNRDAAMETLNRAESAYRDLLQDSDDKQLVSRARFGLGRVYELRNELDKAREEYQAVEGGFAALAKLRAEKLEQQETKQIYDWLASAEAPRRRQPSGPGIPGVRPEFTAGELDIPTDGESAESDTATTVEDLFKGFGFPEEPDDRYDVNVETAPGETDTEDDAEPQDPADQDP